MYKISLWNYTNIPYFFNYSNNLFLFFIACYLLVYIRGCEYNIFKHQKGINVTYKRMLVTLLGIKGASVWKEKRRGVSCVSCKTSYKANIICSNNYCVYCMSITILINFIFFCPNKLKKVWFLYIFNYF